MFLSCSAALSSPNSSRKDARSPRRRKQHVLFVAIAALAVSTATASAFTFTRIGIPAGESASEVLAVDDAVSLAGCFTSHSEQGPTRRYTRSTAARWTPAEGLKQLPLLPSTPSSAERERPQSVVGAMDLTNNGARLLFTSHTTPEEGRAAATCSADGSNVVPITSSPGGQDLQVGTQISDDAATIFGYYLDAQLNTKPVFWTAGGGFQPLALPAGFNAAAPISRCISADGKTSAGNMWNANSEIGTSSTQAYRWTATGGVSGLGFLPGGDYSATLALSSDGSTVIGISTVDPDGFFSEAALFMWTPSGGMIDLGRPEYNYGYAQLFDSAGVSADGSVAAVGLSDVIADDAADVSYIVNTAEKSYVEFTEAVAKAGGSDAIAGWSNFVIRGITDNGNTVFGRARSPDGKTEGFIAQFPPGFLRKMERPARLANIATRLRVGSGNRVSIAGFIITGNVPKRVILRGIGPSLAGQGVQDALTDPVLELHRPDGSVVTNDDWKSSQRAEIETTGVAPANDREAAIVATLAPGSYTAVLSGKNSGIGVGLVELYDLNSTADARLANISTRGFVDTGESAMIGGVIVRKGTTRVLIRAIGPSLQSAGVTGALLDPQLNLHDADGTLYKSNDNWKETDDEEGDAEAITRTGLAPSDDRESAIRTFLLPGNWTAIVRGADGGTGVALVEVYDLGRYSP